MTTRHAWSVPSLLLLVAAQAHAGTTCASLFDAFPDLESGIYEVDPDGRGGVSPMNVFCDMSDLGEGTASIFAMDGDLQLDTRQCLFNNFVDDHDSTLMWWDFTTRLSNRKSDETGGGFWTVSRQGQPSIASPELPGRPAGLGDSARPIPFPAMGLAVWMDWQNQRFVWDINTISFAAAGFVDPGLNFRDHVIVSDGVSSAHVSRLGTATAFVLEFDFDASTVRARGSQAVTVANSHVTEQDAFGHLLYTVNGRASYYQDSRFVLGGPLDKPSVNTTDFAMNPPSGGSVTQHGMDFFSRVDDSGALYFGDWGHDNGGFFGCGLDNQLGEARSNIRLTFDLTPIDLTPDADDDDIADDIDNCPLDANPQQEDVDGDGLGDACDVVNDIDFDDDGVNNPQDNCPFQPNTDQSDVDNDRIGDVCDGLDNLDVDGDTVDNAADNCAFIPNRNQDDTDADGLGDACDPTDDSGGPSVADIDEDGVSNADDNCPFDANLDQADADEDDLGDACDTVDNRDDIDPADVDGDGVANLTDNCAFAPNGDQADGDGDGVGDACDPTDNADLDDDGVDNLDDNCPFQPNADQADSDSDGQGDACDSSDGNDLDGDGVSNESDNCPVTANPTQADSDEDGQGDACDGGGDVTDALDIDADGVSNAQDNCPFTANADQEDADGDGVGDACDDGDEANDDLDGDGVANAQDNCPFTANADQADGDSDGLGDACDGTDDADVDGDGVANRDDNCPFDANEGQADADEDGAGDACDLLDDTQTGCSSVPMRPVMALLWMPGLLLLRRRRG